MQPLNAQNTAQLATWRSLLARAMHRNRALVYSRYVQLATVQADGRPANRTVVFRGFRNHTNQLKFVTDYRSQKTQQLQHNPWAEICWYFPKTREQFRISGQITLVSADETHPELAKLRQITWQELSDSARVQFAWPEPEAPRASAAAFSLPPPDVTIPLVNFCLLLLEPTRVDHLELRAMPQNRCIYRMEANANWTTETVNP